MSTTVSKHPAADAVTPSPSAANVHDRVNEAREHLGRVQSLLSGVVSVCSLSSSHEARDMTNDEGVACACLTNAALETLERVDSSLNAIWLEARDLGVKMAHDRNTGRGGRKAVRK